MKNLFVMMCMLVFVSACGRDDQEQAPAGPAPAATQAEQQTESGPESVSPGVARNIDGIMIVDHSRDEKEFELRRSINGVKSMIETAKEEGQDVSEQESRLAELEKQLQELLGG